MRKLIIRIDDLGYSEATNYGMYKTIEHGLVKNVGLMTNMLFIEHGYDLIKSFDKLCLGVHVNISVGKPISSPSLVKSLIDNDGNFKSSSYYRKHQANNLNMDEVEIETKAQYKRFIELTGREPDYIDIHAIPCENFIKAVQNVANELSLPFSSVPNMTGYADICNKEVYMLVNNSKDVHDFSRINAILNNSNKINMIVFHPGYVDQYLLNNSSLSLERTIDCEILCSDTFKNKVKDNDIELITYLDLKR